jgi:hypothetical protein
MLKIRKANIDAQLRAEFERYGIPVMQQMLSHARFRVQDDFANIETYQMQVKAWLTEEHDRAARRDRWIPLRDLILEIVVIALIGWEIHLGYKQETQQSENFNAQQQILTNLNNSSKSTADTLASLKETTDSELAALKESAATSAKALHISERAYIACVINLPTPPKEGEKLHLAVIIRNSGQSTAVHVETESGMVTVF